MCADTDFWHDYDKWNKALTEHFFSEAAAGRPVYLDVEDGLLVSLSAQLGVDTDDPVTHFRETVVETMALFDLQTELLAMHLARLREWIRADRPDPPPFIGLLAFFCHVADDMKTTSEFKAHNFYSPLTLALRLPLEDQYRKHVEDGFSESARFWDELTLWMEDQYGLRGLPTANPLDQRVYVSRVLSQSLLRLKDRRHLPEIFVRFRLRPGQEVLPRDMLRLMDEWISNSAMSAEVKNLWSRSEARQRMSEIASMELSVWDGSMPEDDAGRATWVPAPIKLLANFYAHPSPRINWAVAVRKRPDIPGGTYDVVDDSQSIILEDGQVTKTLKLKDGVYPEWFDEVTGLSIPDLLIWPLSLRHESADANIEWSPRPIVILVDDEAFPHYSSQPRLELSKRSIILVHERLAERVFSALKPVTHPGLEQYAPAELEGLPEGWCLIGDVFLLGVPDINEDDDELNVLVPLSFTSVGFIGGLSLPGIGVWSSLGMPTMTVASVDDVTAVGAEIKAQRSDGGEPGLKWSGSEAGPVLVKDLADLGLPAGEYRLEVTTTRNKRKTRVQSRSLHTKSADSPRPIDEDLQLAYTLGPETALSALTARAGSGAGGLRLRGALLECSEHGPVDSTCEHVKAQTRSSTSRLAGLGTDGPGGAEALAAGSAWDLERPAPTLARRDGTFGCIVGAHHELLDPAVRGPSKIHVGECKYCGMTRRYPAKIPPPKPARTLATTPAPTPPTQTIVMAPPPSEGSQIDTLLDALCFIGAGDWAVFEFLSSQLANQPWFNVETAYLMSALGHIDIELDLQSMKPSAWSVAPTTVAVLPGDGTEAALAGFRSSSLIERLSAAAPRFGVTVTARENEGAPRSFLLSAPSEGAFAELCAELDDSVPSGVHLSHVNDVLSGMLPPICAVVPSLTEADPAEGLEVRRFAQDGWKDTTSTAPDGLYEFRTRPLKHCLRVGGQFLSVDTRIGKHLAACLDGRPLLAYDRASRTLLCPLGAPLPGVYGRAAVLSSGTAPVTNLSKVRIEYPGVPDGVALALHRCMLA